MWQLTTNIYFFMQDLLRYDSTSDLEKIFEVIDSFSLSGRIKSHEIQRYILNLNIEEQPQKQSKENIEYISKENIEYMIQKYMKYLDQELAKLNDDEAKDQVSLHFDNKIISIDCSDFLKTRYGEFEPLNIKESIKILQDKGKLGYILQNSFSFLEREEISDEYKKSIKKNLEKIYAYQGYIRNKNKIITELQKIGIDTEKLREENIFYLSALILVIKNLNSKTNFDPVAAYLEYFNVCFLNIPIITRGFDFKTGKEYQEFYDDPNESFLKKLHILFHEFCHVLQCNYIDKAGIDEKNLFQVEPQAEIFAPICIILEIYKLLIKKYNLDELNEDKEANKDKIKEIKIKIKNKLYQEIFNYTSRILIKENEIKLESLYYNSSLFYNIFINVINDILDKNENRFLKEDGEIDFRKIYEYTAKKSLEHYEFLNGLNTLKIFTEENRFGLIDILMYNFYNDIDTSEKNKKNIVEFLNFFEKHLQNLEEETKKIKEDIGIDINMDFFKSFYISLSFVKKDFEELGKLELFDVELKERYLSLVLYLNKKGILSNLKQDDSRAGSFNLELLTDNKPVEEIKNYREYLDNKYIKIPELIKKIELNPEDINIQNELLKIYFMNQNFKYKDKLELKSLYEKLDIIKNNLEKLEKEKNDIDISEINKKIKKLKKEKFKVLIEILKIKNNKIKILEEYVNNSEKKLDENFKNRVELKIKNLKNKEKKLLEETLELLALKANIEKESFKNILSERIQKNGENLLKTFNELFVYNLTDDIIEIFKNIKKEHFELFVKTPFLSDAMDILSIIDFINNTKIYKNKIEELYFCLKDCYEKLKSFDHDNCFNIFSLRLTIFPKLYISDDSEYFINTDLDIFDFQKTIKDTFLEEIIEVLKSDLSKKSKKSKIYNLTYSVRSLCEGFQWNNISVKEILKNEVKLNIIKDFIKNIAFWIKNYDIKSTCNIEENVYNFIDKFKKFIKDEESKITEKERKEISAITFLGKNTKMLEKQKAIKTVSGSRDML